MKSLIFIVLFLTTQLSFGQTNLDFDSVIVDSNFNTSKQLLYTSYKSSVKRDSINFNIEDIIYSTNEFEIRLRTFNLLRGSYSLSIVSYNDNHWYAKKYLHSESGPIVKNIQVSVTPSLTQEFLYDKVFETLFDTLKANNIFLLPKVSLDEYSNKVKDGVLHSITFKAEKKFRYYVFSNPETYQRLYPEVEDFKNYSQIVLTLSKLFD